MFPLAGDANVLIFSCLPGTIAAVEVSAYRGISSVARLFRWFAAVSKGRLRAVLRVMCCGFAIQASSGRPCSYGFQPVVGEPLILLESWVGCS